MTTTDQATRAVDDLGVDPLAGGGGQQLGVGQPGHPAPPAGREHAGGGHQRAGAGAAAGLVGAGDGGEPAAAQRALHVPERVGAVVVGDRAPAARPGSTRSGWFGQPSPSDTTTPGDAAGTGTPAPDARRAGLPREAGPVRRRTVPAIRSRRSQVGPGQVGGSVGRRQAVRRRCSRADGWTAPARRRAPGRGHPACAGWP